MTPDVDDDLGEVLVLQDELLVAFLLLRVFKSAFETAFDVVAILRSELRLVEAKEVFKS